METLVAITILIIVIMGPFQIVQGVLQTSYTARDQLIATGLAQEAIEYVRQVRDSNFLYNLNHGAGSVTWLAGFDGTGAFDCGYTGTASACIVDPVRLTIASCGGVACTCGGTSCAAYPLQLSATNLYTQDVSAANPTRFSRAVQFIPVPGFPNEMQVKVTVSWNNHGAKSVVLIENIQNWL